MPEVRVVGEVRAPPDPSDDDWEGPREYPSPGGAWTLRFHDPSEFAMGAYSWEVTLLQGTAEVARLPDATSTDVQPWSSDSTTYAYPGRAGKRSSALMLRTVEGREPRVPRLEFLITVQWSQSRDRLLAVGAEDVTLLTGDGKVVATVSGSGVEGEWPITGWLPSGDYFFVVGRTAREAPSELRFFSVDGAPVGGSELDPAGLAPYDAAPYDRLRRDFWSLDIGSSAAVGSFLDCWAASRYDPSTGELNVAVYRPTSPPFEVEQEWGREWVCHAEERWVAVELGE